MPSNRLRPIEEYRPQGEPHGCILVVSDHRPLNLGHAAMLRRHGYCVYTAITCTDVTRVFDHYAVGELELVVFASLVHAWHHAEGERRPSCIPPATDPDWQIRNMTAVVDIIAERQGSAPRVLIAEELMTCGWYTITEETLAKAGLEYQTYPANDPHAIVGLLRSSAAASGEPSP